MLFDVWGSDTLIHWAGWAMVFIGLIVLNEVGRRVDFQSQRNSLNGPRVSAASATRN